MSHHEKTSRQFSKNCFCIKKKMCANTILKHYLRTMFMKTVHTLRTGFKLHRQKMTAFNLSSSLSHHYHQFLNHKGSWGTTDDFATSSLHFSCSPLPSGTCRTPGLSIPWCCLPTSSSVCLVFFPLSMCLARWFWPEMMNRRHVHTTSVCASLWWSRGLRVVQLPAGSWHKFPHC